MQEAIRKNLRNFVAVMVLLVVALVTTYVIIQEQRLRIPVLEEKPFELKAEFETAQAVVPGQGQTLRVAGVRIGDVQDVEVENGVGVVTFAIDREFLPIYRDATILMRPTTGLKDMFFDMDPGTKKAGEFEEGDMLAVSNTAPDVNLDEILEALDSDTQAYLRLLLVGAGQGLSERDRELGKLLGSIGPINRDLARLNSLVAQRKENLSRLIHNMNVLTNRIGQNGADLSELVVTSEAALGAIAEQDPNVQRAVRLLPGTLSQARATLDETARFAELLGPTFNDLRPFARRLDEVNASTSELARTATPALRDEIRPFVRAARPPLPDLRAAADEYSRTAPRLTAIGKQVNNLLNMAAYNPDGAEQGGEAGRNEGFLYWLAWLNHNSSSVWSAGDGTGFMRRIYLTMGCEQAQNLVTGLGGGAIPPELGAILDPVVGAVTGFTPPTLQELGCA
jgi:phospholipid/cholesterol/gamma-HCH transport system substrate-binding protein